MTYDNDNENETVRQRESLNGEYLPKTLILVSLLTFLITLRDKKDPGMATLVPLRLGEKLALRLLSSGYRPCCISLT